VKPRKLRGFSGKGDETWDAYCTHLEIVKRFNQWDNDTALSYFCSELCDAALEFFSSLDSDERQDYDCVMAAMTQRFGTLVNIEAVRARLENTRQKPTQSLEELASQIRKLAYTVYAKDPPERREKEAVRAFMMSVTSQYVIQALIQAGAIATMTEALRIATRAQEMGTAFLRSSRPVVRVLREDSDDSGEPNPMVGVEEFSSEESELQCLAEQLRGLLSQGHEEGPRGLSPVSPDDTRVCWLCGEKGHMSSTCPYRPRNWPTWMREMIEAFAKGQGVAPPSMPAPLVGGIGRPSAPVPLPEGNFGPRRGWNGPRWPRRPFRWRAPWGNPRGPPPPPANVAATEQSKAPAGGEKPLPQKQSENC
jgi:hypothetical protein